MEKRTPHHRLDEVKALVEADAMKVTFSATVTGRELGFSEIDIKNIVKSLSRNDFNKSMTSYSDHQEWQDVYNPKTTAGIVYLKLTVRGDVVILSFKEK